MKTCTKCSLSKSMGDFHAASKRKDGKHSWCKDCVKDAARTRYMKNMYGMTVHDYDALRIEQEFCCKLCGVHETASSGRGLLHIDHCHDTGVVRGLLCGNCNTAIGLLNDDPELILKVASYINKHKGD